MSAAALLFLAIAVLAAVYIAMGCTPLGLALGFAAAIAGMVASIVVVHAWDRLR